MLKKLLLLGLGSLLLTSLNAQEVYLSISGQNSTAPSGDSRHQYDIWLKPESASSAFIQIFDAGFGGNVDFDNQNAIKTTTSFYLYRFDDLFTYDGETVIPTGNNPDPVATLQTQDEERFKTRWVDLNESALRGSGNGFILRVATDEGDDINSYNVRVINPQGRTISGDSWKIIAIDLSLALFRSTPQKYFQLRPYNEEISLTTTMSLAGQEDSKVSKIDAFGSQYETLQSVENMDTRLGLPNNWGLNISGSADWLNTLTIYGTENPVLWLFEPIVIDVLVKPEVNVYDEPSRKCTEQVFDLTSNTISIQSLAESIWINGEEPVGNGMRPTIEFSKKGENSLRVLVPNNTSYFPSYWVYNHDVFVNTPPVAKLTIPKNIVSPGEQIILSADESYDPEGRELSYTWLVNGIRRGDRSSSFTFSNTISGEYTVSVQVSDGGNSPNCSNAQKLNTIRVNTQPYGEISLPELIGTAEEVTASVMNATDADNDSLTFKWVTSATSDTLIGETVTLSEIEPGNFEVTLLIDDGTGSDNAIYTTRYGYEVNAAPIAQFSLPEKTAPGDIIQLDGSASSDPNQDALNYSWLVNGEFVSDSVSAEYVFPAPGDYEVSLLVSDGKNVSNSENSISRSIHVNAAPVPVIESLDLSPVSTIDFSARSSTDAENQIATFNWDFGDGNTGSGPQISHTYSSSGTYMVKLTVDDGEGLSNSVRSIEKTVAVNSHPIASFDAPEVVAPGEPFVADASTSTDAEGYISSYEWFLDDQPVGNETTLSLSIEDEGTHTLTLRVRDDSGFEDAQGVLTKAIRVNQPPVAAWSSSPAVVEPGKSVQFSAAGAYDPDGQIVSYEWVFNDTLTLQGQTIDLVFEDGGPKRFSLTITDNSGVANSVTVIEDELAVNHEPYIITEKIIRTNNLRVRLNASESYDLNGDPLSFEWTLPDGSKRSDSNFNWTAPRAGVHILSLSVDDGQGLTNSINSETIQVLVNSPVKAVVEPVISSCTGQTVLFNSSQSFDPDGDPFSVKWTFGDGNASALPNPSHRYESTGQYTATLQLHDGFSEDTTYTEIPVIIEGSPIARMEVSQQTVCVNSRLVFDGRNSSDPSGNLPSFLWDMGDGTTKSGGLIDHVFTTSGEYTITLTVEGSGSGNCSNIAQTSTTVYVIAGPVADFVLPEYVIPNEDIELDGSASTAEDGFRSAVWTIERDSVVATLEGISQTYSFVEAGEYTVTLDLTTNTETTCNRVSLTKSIKVNAPPVIALDVPEISMLGSDLKVSASQSYDPDGYIASYNWYFDGELISTNASEIIKLENPGFHTIRLVVKDNSSATNNTAVKEARFFVNSPPEPVINGPSSVFQNQAITLSTSSVVDADGDVLTTTWYVDGEEVPAPVIQAEQNRSYRVVLVQDDGRGLSNSVDSAVVQFSPRSYPAINPVYPERIVVGGRLNLADMNVGENIGFVNGALFDDYWVANTLGESSFTMGWRPDNSVLFQLNFRIMVEEALRFSEAVEQVEVNWDPANPKALLVAPSVNREISDVLYTWKRNGRIIGYGKRIEVPVSQGQNLFIVEVNDQKVAYSQPVSANITVTAQ